MGYSWSDKERQCWQLTHCADLKSLQCAPLLGPDALILQAQERTYLFDQAFGESCGYILRMMNGRDDSKNVNYFNNTETGFPFVSVLLLKY